MTIARRVLVLRLDIVQVVGRVTGPCDRRRIGRHAEVSEDASDRLTLGDDGQHAKPTLALRALEHIHVERSPQRLAQSMRVEAA